MSQRNDTRPGAGAGDGNGTGRGGGNGRADLVIVGAGVSGLTLAYEVRKRRPEWKVAVLESAAVPGGTMRSERVAGCLCEWGPNGFLTNVPHTWDLARELGLADRMVVADARAERRFLYIDGRLQEVKPHPVKFLRSGLLSLPGKLRLVLEPFMPKRRSSDDESIFSFASRRIGKEAATKLVDAMVTGIHAGDSRRLSLRATFPRMADMEARYGSLVKAMMAIRKERRREGKAGGGPAGPGGRLVSFDEGMAVLIRTLADRTPDLRLETSVEAVERDGDDWILRLDDGSSLRTPRAVFAVPADRTAPLLQPVAPEAAEAIGGIDYAPIAVVCLVYPGERVAHDLQGFGFLVPRDQGSRLLGCIWSGSVFPVHVTGGRVLLRAMVGGARDPGSAMLPEDELVDLVRSELDRILGGLSGEPEAVRVFRWKRGIPQYVVGHLDRLAAIDAGLARAPGLYVAGNAYRGIGVNDCVREAARLAGELAGAGPEAQEPDAVAAGEGAP